MKTKLTLQEKLRDLRDEKKMTLSDLAGTTGIPLSTLQRMEGKEGIRVGYQDVAALAKYYEVSTDYLFGLTDNRQHRHIEIDALQLSDPAIETLKNEKLNNRLVSEMLAHPDFIRMMQSIEIYVDRKLFTQINQVNSLYQLAENAIKANFDPDSNDENIALLQDAVVDEDSYLRFQISERFNDFMKSLFASHKKDTLPDEQAGILQVMMETLSLYLQAEDKEHGKVLVMAKQMGVEYAQLTAEEIAIMKGIVQKADANMEANNRRE